ncbi:DUF5825 family protein [Streptomyces sp. NPDC005805]|uniref:DUF5825 family protein n=1 Tax=Streptomyces sp. NPDC005805 TaxID=3157068 RepID=UPI0033F4A3F7
MTKTQKMADAHVTPLLLGLGPRTEHLSGSLDAGAFTQLDIAALAMHGCDRLKINSTVELGRNAEHDIRFMHLLRQSASHGITVSWQADGLPDCPPSYLHHLPPPHSTLSADTQSMVDQWRDEYTYGLCYYRQGPGFWQIRDGRSAGRRGRFTAVGEKVIQTLAQLTQPADAMHLPELATDMLQSLHNAGLTAQIGPWVLLLPYRLRRWPIPAYGI